MLGKFASLTKEKRQEFVGERGIRRRKRGQEGGGGRQETGVEDYQRWSEAESMRRDGRVRTRDSLSLSSLFKNKIQLNIEEV